jgi:hypothetical protein
VSKRPVASGCEHARDPELHTDDAPSCMSNCEGTNQFLITINNSVFRCWLVGSLPEAQDGDVCVGARRGLAQSV